MASRKEYAMMFQLQAQMASSFNGTFGKAQAAIANMQKEIQALSKTQSDIAGYQKQQSAVEATRQKLAVLQQQYDNIQKEMKETEGYSSALENKLLSKQQQIDRTTASLNQQTQKLNEMEASLQKAGINTANLTQESARLGGQIDDLKAKQEEAADGAQGFGSASVQAFGAIQQAIVAAGIAAALKEIAGAYMECVTAAGDLEEGMSTVEALSGASAEEMAALKAEAKELGATTKFTAQEAADAMGYMGMAGWSAADMLQGMDGVLQLAAASGEDLAMVSDIVTDNLTAFGLKASDTAHFADVLAAAATNSNTNVAIMGETFKMSASIAGALGYSVEDVATAVGLMANSGIKGSIAGTALKNTFNGLLEGVTLTSAAFGEYEYTAVKADGTMKGFRDTIDELRIYFDQMTEAERVNNAMTIAGQRGYNGLLAILNATDADYASLASSIDNCTGAASKMASIKLDNMNGELVLMNSAWDALKTTIGEQFIPEMRGLYQIGADVFGVLDDFVEENPAVVKAGMAFVGVIGAATAGLTAYAAISKVVKALDMASMFTNPVFLGATAVAALAVGIVALASSADDAIPSVKELTEEAREMQNTIADAQKVYEDTASETMAAANMADRYISKLDEMEAQYGDAASEQEEYQNTLALLLQTMPSLSSYISQTTDEYGRVTYALNANKDALRANTEEWKRNAMAQAYQEQLTAMYAAQADVMIEAQQNSIKRTKAVEDLTAAQEEQQAATERMGKLWNEAVAEADRQYKEYGILADASAYLSQEYYDLENSLSDLNQEVWNAQDAVDNYQKAIDEDNEAVAQAQEEMALYQEAMEDLLVATQEGSQATEEATQQTEALNGVIEGTIEDAKALAEAYTEAYNAAYESVHGQYALWDEADQVIATSVGNINQNLESQIAYWDSYNQNLESLRERASDIEGLQEVIASFADGSTESVNAIAGMAAASDEDLAAMVVNYQELQQAQKDTTLSIADLQENFSEQMELMTEALADDIEAMDFGTEAAAAGKATIDGFIKGAGDQLPRVQSMYKALAQAAKNSLYPGSGGSSGYVPTTYLRAYAQGTRYAQEGAALVGEYGPELVYMRGGETVFTAQQTASALRASPAISAELATSRVGISSAPISVTFQIEGNATPEIVHELRDYGDDFAEQVMAVIEDAQADAARRAYQ